MFVVINYTNGSIFKTELVHNKDNEPKVFNTIDEAEDYAKKNLFFKFQVLELYKSSTKDDTIDITQEMGTFATN